jgi:hypothetical protein
VTGLVPASPGHSRSKFAANDLRCTRSLDKWGWCTPCKSAQRLSIATELSLGCLAPAPRSTHTLAQTRCDGTCTCRCTRVCHKRGMLSPVCVYELEVLFCGSGIGDVNKCRCASMLSHLPFETFTSCMLLMYSSVSRLVAFEPSPNGGWMLRTNLTKSSVLIVRSSSHMAHHMPVRVSPSVTHQRNTLSASGV